MAKCTYPQFKNQKPPSQTLTQVNLRHREVRSSNRITPLVIHKFISLLKEGTLTSKRHLLAHDQPRLPHRLLQIQLEVSNKKWHPLPGVASTQAGNPLHLLTLLEVSNKKSHPLVAVHLILVQKPLNLQILEMQM
nr:uncharacterized protein LOC129271476 [Lytechinus pictus]